jgi:HSP20 family protein
MVEKTQSGGFWPNLYDPFRQFGKNVADWFAPASEAATSEDGYRIAIELPGVAESDIDLSVHDGVLTLKGEKRSEKEEKGETWYFSEREYGSFSRSFRLPPDADGAKVDAHMKDGVLTITVPRLAPAQAAGARRVEIRRQ